MIRLLSCSVPDCAGSVLARGWCSKHYQRWERHGDPLTIVRPNTANELDHWNVIDLRGKRFGRLTVLSRAANATTPGGTTQTRWNAECDCGTTNVTVRSNHLRDGQVSSCGCIRTEVSRALGRAKRRETVKYRAAHRRMVVDRGPATSYDCCDCGSMARHWSYNAACPGELASKEGLRYCLHAEHYSPRCVPCHRDFDRRKRGSDTRACAT